jgi:hypothetical protein
MPIIGFPVCMLGTVIDLAKNVSSFICFSQSEQSFAFETETALFAATIKPFPPQQNHFVASEANTVVSRAKRR